MPHLKYPSQSTDQAELQRRIGATLRLHRQRMGLSQVGLASRAQISRTYLADIERGARHPLLSTISRFSAALGISLAMFFSTFESMEATDENPTVRKTEKT